MTFCYKLCLLSLLFQTTNILHYNIQYLFLSIHIFLQQFFKSKNKPKSFVSLCFSIPMSSDMTAKKVDSGRTQKEYIFPSKHDLFKFYANFIQRKNYFFMKFLFEINTRAKIFFVRFYFGFLVDVILLFAGFSLLKIFGEREKSFRYWGWQAKLFFPQMKHCYDTVLLENYLFCIYSKEDYELFI